MQTNVIHVKSPINKIDKFIVKINSSFVHAAKVLSLIEKKLDIEF